MSLKTIDCILIGGYVAMIMALGVFSKQLLAWWRSKHRSYFIPLESDDAGVSQRTRDVKPVGDNPNDYFLATRDTSWWAVACSYFASNIGSDAIVGTAGAAATCGLPVALFDWGSALIAFTLLAYLYLPAYYRLGIFTIPEFLQRRYGNGMRTYLACISIFVYTFRIGANLYAGGVVLTTVLGWSKFLSLWFLIACTGAYVVIGGLHAIIVTEVLQTAFLGLSSIIMMLYSLRAVGGWAALLEKLPGFWLVLLQDGDAFEWEPAPYPYRWLSMLLGFPFLTCFFHCADQEMVQRGLASRNLDHARGGAIAAGFLKILPPFIFVFPGMIARVLDTEEGWGELGCGSDYKGTCSSADRAFPLLVNRLLPSGLAGIVVATLLVALMSSLAAVFNSISTVFTLDIYQKIHAPGLRCQLRRSLEYFGIKDVAEDPLMPPAPGGDHQLVVHLFNLAS
eukprot:gene1497-2125_t